MAYKLWQPVALWNAPPTRTINSTIFSRRMQLQCLIRSSLLDIPSTDISASQTILKLAPQNEMRFESPSTSTLEYLHWLLSIPFLRSSSFYLWLHAFISTLRTDRYSISKPQHLLDALVVCSIIEEDIRLLRMIQIPVHAAS